MSDRLKAARQRAGLSQEELAARINRSVEGISKIERGVNLPSLDTLLEICGALSLNAGDLVQELQPSDARPLIRERERDLLAICQKLPDADLELAFQLVMAVQKSRRV